MRKHLAYTLLISMLGFTALVAQEKKTPAPPTKVTIPAKPGPVTFDHTAHAKREKNECKTCHPSLFTQNVKAPVKFKPPHKAEEDKKTSCGFCHRPDGPAFATAGNCANGKCHVKPGAKKG